MQKFVHSLSGWMAGFACICLVVLMLLTFLDVVGRYFFNAPLTFAVELTELAMGLLVAFGLAVTTLRHGHIAVDLISTASGKFLNAILVRLAAMTGVVFLAVVAWRLWDRGLNFMSDGLATQILFLPVFPVVLLMAVAALIAAFISLMQLLGTIQKEESDASEKMYD